MAYEQVCSTKRCHTFYNLDFNKLKPQCKPPRSTATLAPGTTHYKPCSSSTVKSLLWNGPNISV